MSRFVRIAAAALALSALGFTIAFRWTSVTGGENGLGGIERPVLPGLDLNDNLSFYILVAVIALAAAALMWRFVNSPLGHVLEAIRENETRATALGYDTQRYKLAAFVLSAGITALAGVLLVTMRRLSLVICTRPLPAAVRLMLRLASVPFVLMVTAFLTIWMNARTPRVRKITMVVRASLRQKWKH